MSGEKAMLEPVRQETLEQLQKYYAFVYQEINAKEKETYPMGKGYKKYDFVKQHDRLCKMGINIPYLMRLSIQWDPNKPEVIYWHGTDNGFEHSRKSYHGDIELSESAAQIMLGQMKEEAFELGKFIYQKQQEENKRLEILAIVKKELSKVSLPTT